MDADRALKKLFKLRAGDLLPITGDRGAEVLSGRIPELGAVTRRPDFVLKLQRGREVYLRHLEFEMRYDPSLPLRVFEYAAGLCAEYGLPVACTVIILKGRAPSFLVHEERVSGRIECRRRIRVVRIGQMRPAEAMGLGLGGTALVGLVGPPRLGVLEAAARRIESESSPRQRRDLWTILRMLSEGRYTGRDLERVVPKEVVMSSSLVAYVKRQSRAEGRAEGEITAARDLCLDFVRQHHPDLRSRLAPAIQACADVALLRTWALAAPQMSDDEFARRIAADSRGHLPPAEARAPRPSRRARPSSRPGKRSRR